MGCRKVECRKGEVQKGEVQGGMQGGVQGRMHADRQSATYVNTPWAPEGPERIYWAQGPPGLPGHWFRVPTGTLCLCPVRQIQLQAIF